MTHVQQTIRIAAVGDIHCKRQSRGSLGPLFSAANAKADILILCGDLTDTGLAEEAVVLAGELSEARIPVIAVLGNHDFESEQEGKVAGILKEAGVHVLDGDCREFYGVGFAGVKGFMGGFGRGALGPWGEGEVKRFVDVGTDESDKLDRALSQLDTLHRIAVLHYAPIPETLEGEPREIFPYLGSSHLEEALNRHPVTAAFHGHAHKGIAQAKTRTGIPVYNVAMPLLKSLYPGEAPLRVIEIEI